MLRLRCFGPFRHATLAPLVISSTFSLAKRKISTHSFTKPFRLRVIISRCESDKDRLEIPKYTGPMGGMVGTLERVSSQRTVHSGQEERW